VGPKGVKGGRRTLLYIEAVRRYIDVFQMLDLSEPYQKVIRLYTFILFMRSQKVVFDIQF